MMIVIHIQIIKLIITVLIWQYCTAVVCVSQLNQQCLRTHMYITRDTI